MKGPDRDMRRVHSVGAYSLMEILVAVSIIGTVIALALPIQARFRTYVDEQSCQAVQRNITAALQSYNLDKNKKRADIPKVIEVLARERYLEKLPEDPGEGPDTWTHFRFDRSTNSVSCRRHSIAAIDRASAN